MTRYKHQSSMQKARIVIVAAAALATLVIDTAAIIATQEKSQTDRLSETNTNSSDQQQNANHNYNQQNVSPNQTTFVYDPSSFLASKAAAPSDLSKQHQSKLDTFDTNSQKSGRSRAGRMLDLDALVGDFQASKERHIESGARQSRQLNQQQHQLPMSVDGKRLQIQGFIPIVGLAATDQPASSGSSSFAFNDLSTASFPSSSSSQQFSSASAMTTAEQPLRSPATSLGHATFVDSPRAASHLSSTHSTQSLLSNKLSLLKRAPFPFPKHQQQQQQVTGQDAECICVPFYMCRSGQLAADTSRAQLDQLLSQQPTLQQQPVIQPAPRQLFQLAGDQQQQQQQTQPMPIEQLLDERSTEALNGTYTLAAEDQQDASAASVSLQQQQQDQNNGTLSEYSADVLARVLGLQRLAPARRSPAANSAQAGGQCGVFRTCCSLPPTLHQQQQQLQQPQLQQQALGLWTPQQSPRQQPEIKSSPLRQQQLLTQLSSQLSRKTLLPQQMQPMQPMPAIMQHQFPLASNSLLHEPLPQLGTRKLLEGRCGLRLASGIGGRVQNVVADDASADFGEYPSQVAVLKRLPSSLTPNSAADNMFVCGGTLISQFWVATAAHCIKKLSKGELKVRVGEWDTGRDDEMYGHAERLVRDVVVHPEFAPATLVADLALLRLDAPVDASLPHVSPACLPVAGETFAGRRCWVAGWGKDAFGAAGAYQTVLREVELPVWQSAECELALRRTRLGPHFRLHGSFMCAGGAAGRDACEGDGGSGLYCVEPDGTVKAAGLVSWGVACGTPGVPGVYVSLAAHRAWIENIISIDEDVYSRSSVQLPASSSSPIQVASPSTANSTYGPSVGAGSSEFAINSSGGDDFNGADVAEPIGSTQEPLAAS